MMVAKKVQELEQQDRVHGKINTSNADLLAAHSSKEVAGNHGKSGAPPKTSGGGNGGGKLKPPQKGVVAISPQASTTSKQSDKEK